jgi:hypothetical protein
MNGRDRPRLPDRGEVSFRYGVWVDPNGARIEVVRVRDLWRVYAYTCQTGGSASELVEYNDQGELVHVIAQLEARGYRCDPDRRPDNARNRTPDRRRSSTRTVIGVALIGVLLLTVEYLLLRH